MGYRFSYSIFHFFLVHLVATASAPKDIVQTPPVIQKIEKYAFLLAESNTGIEFAEHNIKLIQSQLIQHGGYKTENISICLHLSSNEVLQQAQTFANRINPQDTVLFYYCGLGHSLEGNDYLIPKNTDLNNKESLIEKEALYKIFAQKRSKIFAFFETPRPYLDASKKTYFGKEPMVGMIAQMQSTVPGGTVESIQIEDQSEGLFANAFVRTLQEFRSQVFPINDFAWSLFSKMRRIGGGQSGGGSRQTPTLPLLLYLGSDACF